MKRSAGELELAPPDCICDPMDLAAMGAHMLNCPARPPSIRLDITATGLRGAGKTYILNRLRHEIRILEAQVPGRKIIVNITEKHGAVK